MGWANWLAIFVNVDSNRSGAGAEDGLPGAHRGSARNRHGLRGQHQHSDQKDCKGGLEAPHFKIHIGASIARRKRKQPHPKGGAVRSRRKSKIRRLPEPF